jgi:hypothetical protein
MPGMNDKWHRRSGIRDSVAPNLCCGKPRIPIRIRPRSRGKVAWTQGITKGGLKLKDSASAYREVGNPEDLRALTPQTPKSR